ncbi:MAG: VWA domain-containing protein, partial [Chloroflexia bacterium]
MKRKSSKAWLAVFSVGLTGAAVWAFAQQADDIIRVTTRTVTAPTSVKDRDGNFINGLDVKDFVVRDNGKLQDIKIDQSYVPVSLVLVIQRSASTEGVLPTIQKIGSMLEPLILGERGEAAIVTFDHRIETIQDFTNDTEKFKKALTTLRPGSQTKAMSDAMLFASRMLKKRSADRRRVIILVSETQESGSVARVKDALLEVELNNVIVYSVNMSRIMNKILAKPDYPRPNPIPPSARPMPAGMPNTPTTQAQMSALSGTMGNVMPLFKELFTAGKAVFISNPQEVYTKYTGGSEYSFLNLRGFEEAVQKLGEELQHQYIVSYSPSKAVQLDGGWHTIDVEVR